MRLSHAEEIEFFSRARTGDIKARELIVEAHIPLAEALAHKQYRKYKPMIERDDLLGAAYEGLMIAVDRYDHSAGHRFGTYASYWILNRIGLQVRHEKWWLPHIPDSIYRSLLLLLDLQKDFIATHNRIPFARELVEVILSLPPATGAQLYHLFRFYDDRKGGCLFRSTRFQPPTDPLKERYIHSERGAYFFLNTCGDELHAPRFYYEKLLEILSWAQRGTVVSLNLPVGDRDITLSDCLKYDMVRQDATAGAASLREMVHCALIKGLVREICG
jgi:hypothetical protein